MGRQYYGTSTTINGTTWRAELHRNASALDHELKLMAAPTLFYQGEGQRLHEQVVMPSRAEVTFIMRDSNDHGNFVLIAQDPEQEWSMRIYKNGTLYWVGRVAADQMRFSREDPTTGYASITITAVDGLELLSNYYVQSSWFTIGDRQDIISMLVQILGVLNLQDAWGGTDDYIFESTGITNANAGAGNTVFSTVRNAAFLKTFDLFKDPDTLEWVDCRTALEYIMRGFFMGARLYHDAGAYWIVHPANYNAASFPFDSYDKSGSALSSGNLSHKKLLSSTAGLRSKWAAKPVKSFQQPIRQFDAEFIRKNGQVSIRTTASSSILNATHTGIISGTNLPIKIEVKYKFGYGSILTNKYVTYLRIYARNPTNGKLYMYYLYGWTEVTSTTYGTADLDLSAATFGTYDGVWRKTIDSPPSGATEVYVDFYIKNKLGVLLTTGSHSSTSGKLIVDWSSPTVTNQAFTGSINISQSYTAAEPYQFEQKKVFSSTLGTPRNTNSQYPVEELQFYNGTASDVGSVMVLDGTYKQAGAWAAPWTTETGDLPELYAYTFAGLYSDFRPTIRGTVYTDGDLQPIYSLFFDSQYWVFNGGRIDLQADTFSGEWVSILTVYTNVTNGGEGERKNRLPDIIGEQIEVLQGELSRLREIANGVVEGLIVDIINTADGAPTSEPGVNKKYLPKMVYNYDATEPYFSWGVIEENIDQQRIIKPTTETRTGSTTLTADTDLTAAIANGGKLSGEIKILFDTTAAADFKFILNVNTPGGASIYRMEYEYIPPGGGSAVHGVVTSASVVPITGSGTVGGYLKIYYLIENTSSGSGTISLDWAQNTSDGGNTSVLNGSSMVVNTLA